MLVRLDSTDVVATVFLNMALILLVAQWFGALFRRLGQPSVVGEMLAGIALGPSVLGILPGDLSQRLFPPEARPFLNVLAQLGLIIFMFGIGVEFDLALFRRRQRVAAVISLCSIMIPFASGVLLAGVLHQSHDGPARAEDFAPFALFMGVAMSITAFPVLARILTERGMARTDVGVLALACAAVDDVIAWSVLALVVAMVTATGTADFVFILIESGIYVAFMLLIAKPALSRFIRQLREKDGQTLELLPMILVGLLLSAFLTSVIGIHAIFGAFLYGAVLPRENTANLFHEIGHRLEHVGARLLLPIFFIVTGLNMDFRSIGRNVATELPLILLVAIAGKFFGAAGGAISQRVHRRQAATLGVLMNTRGLTEIVILNVGRELEVLDAGLFTMLVVMALVTTIMTQPLLRLIGPLTVTEPNDADERPHGKEEEERS